MAVINHGDNEIIFQKLKEMIEKDLAGIRTALINLVNDIIRFGCGSRRFSSFLNSRLNIFVEKQRY